MESKKHLRQILKDEGFRAVIDNGDNFSTTVHNGIFNQYSKGDVSVYWGLSEVGKPPTLISPRPHIIKDGKIYGLNTDNVVRDDVMNETLLKFDHDDIYKSIIGETFPVFDLDSLSIIKNDKITTLIQDKRYLTYDHVIELSKSMEDEEK